MGLSARRLVGLTAALTALALIIGGCTVPLIRSRRGDGGPVGNARWRECADVAREVAGRRLPNVTFECATITVPQDWTAPAGATGTFDIALLRARAAGQRDRIGSLIVNPGGPGGSGVRLAVYLSVGLPAEITRRFDIVGFDPRGVGRSTQVRCQSDADLDRSFAYEPDPTSQAEFNGAVALARQVGERCLAKYGDTLRFFSTEQAARDLEAVRLAVGDPKITYLGYSYGTLLGATYAQLFPRQIRALVLDGAVDPAQDFIASTESQANGFERAFDHFVDWCASSAGQCPIAPDARAALTEALQAARRKPVRGADGRDATAGWIFTAAVSSLYSQATWPRLATALADLARGDASGIFRLADEYAERDRNGHYSNLFDVFTVVSCTDTDAKISVSQIRDWQSQWREKYPLFGAPSAVSLLTCAQWPGKRDPYPIGPAEGAPPIVVIGTTGDPATPYEQTPKLADMLGVGVVLTWEGEGHTAYPETRCIVQAVNDYLIRLRPPAPGTTCPAR